MLSKCKHEDTDVIDSRPCSDYRRRRYRCGNCGLRWTTFEIKHQTKGMREAFKTLNGLNKSQMAVIKRMAAELKSLKAVA